MKRIRKAVIPAAGPRIALAFALPACNALRSNPGRPTIRSAAHAAALTGRAGFGGMIIVGGYNEKN